VSNKIKIGTFRLGLENVDLFGLSNTNGGYLELKPDDGHRSFIEVGLASKEWDFTVSILLHETLEFLMMRAFVAYASIGRIWASSSSRLFVLSHEQLDNICDRQAVFVTLALPKLATAWKKNQKKGKKK